MKRWTVVVSTLTAALLLGAGVTANPERSVSVDELAGLRSDLEFQVRTAYRFDVPARNARLAALEDADRVWQESPQTEGDRRLMAAWLRGAIGASMPGSRAALPELPGFSLRAVEEAVVQSPVIEAPIETPVAAESPAPPVVSSADAAPTVAARVLPEAQGPPVGTGAALTVVRSAATAVTPTAHAEPVVRGEEPVGRTDDASSLLVSAKRSAVGLNLGELTVRVATYHDLLDEIEAMVADASAWDAGAVGSVRRLAKRARAEHRFATLYYGVLTAEERDRVLRPRDPESVFRAAAEAVKQWRALQDRDFLAP
ncbi:MAG: hypothetical protein AAGA92_10395 [Planctomycetota bacterium]